MHTNYHFLLPRCTGVNCGATDANHSPECRAEHAAAVAGGRFVKDAPIAPRADAERDAALGDIRILEIADRFNFSGINDEIIDFARAILAANGEKP